MDDARIVEFLTRLGARKVRVRGKVVEASCPLAEWKHAGGHDASPSFAVFTSAEGDTRWRCFGCGQGGTLIELVWKLKHHRKQSPEWAHKEDTYLAIHDAPAPETFKERIARLVEKPEDRIAREIAGVTFLPAVLPEKYRHAPAPLPDDTLTTYFEPIPADSPPARVLADRRVPASDVARWELLWHPPTLRLAIPVRDRLGRLVGVSGRADDVTCHRCHATLQKRLLEGKARLWCPGCDRRAPPKYLHAEGFKRDFYLYGEHLLESWHRVAFITEGFFDAIALWRLGYEGAVCVMGTYLSPFQIEKVARLFERAVVIPDGDEAGVSMGRRVYDQLAPRMPTRLVRTPTGLDPDDFTPELARELLGPPPVRVASLTVNGA